LIRSGCLLLLVVAGTQVTPARVVVWQAGPGAAVAAQVRADVTGTAVPVPTVVLPQSAPISVPTVSLPQPTATATPRPTKTRVRKAIKHPPRKTPTPQPSGQWITAFLTSYCPGSAGWLSSSGLTVFYGMLANNYYPFGTHVYIPVIGLTGVVEDHLNAFAAWNQFDVWSPVCYSTPTGYYRVAIQGR
jgi:hypothetical protein